MNILYLIVDKQNCILKEPVRNSWDKYSVRNGNFINMLNSSLIVPKRQWNRKSDSASQLIWKGQQKIPGQTIHLALATSGATSMDLM